LCYVAGDIKSPVERSLRLKRYQAVSVAEEVKILGERVPELRSAAFSVTHVRGATNLQQFQEAAMTD